MERKVLLISLLTTVSEQNTPTIYDEQNRLKIETNELEKIRTFEYDDNGDRTQVIDRLKEDDFMMGKSDRPLSEDAIALCMGDRRRSLFPNRWSRGR